MGRRRMRALVRALCLLAALQPSVLAGLARLLIATARVLFVLALVIVLVEVGLKGRT